MMVAMTTTPTRPGPAATSPVVTTPATGPIAVLRGVLARPLASYYLLLATVGLLMLIGLVMVFSATSLNSLAANESPYSSVTKQVLFAFVGLLAFWVCQRLPVRTL